MSKNRSTIVYLMSQNNVRDVKLFNHSIKEIEASDSLNMPIPFYNNLLLRCRVYERTEPQGKPRSLLGTVCHV